MINQDWTVTFLVDGAPVYTSTCSLSQNLHVRTGIDGRSHNGSAVADDLLVCQ